MTAYDDILADRLNAEPAIFKGCSSSELGVIVGLAALVWIAGAGFFRDPWRRVPTGLEPGTYALGAAHTNARPAADCLEIVRNRHNPPAVASRSCILYH